MDVRESFTRILLKISGEGLCKGKGKTIDPEAVQELAEQIAALVRVGKEVAIVVGAGNIIRGGSLSETSTLSRATADYMGMLATIINGLALQDALENMGFETRLMSAISVPQVAEPFIRRRATRHLEKGRVVILVAGTGNPYFTTDTQAAIRATEIDADCLFKATKVDGVYSADPVKDPSATIFDEMTYEDVIDKKLGIMDIAAVRMCQENDIPIAVFNLRTEGNIFKAANGEKVGTLITGE